MTEQTILSKTQKCRVCGHEGFDVSVGIWKSRKSRFHVILRCTDHAACAERAAAL